MRSRSPLGRRFLAGILLVALVVVGLALIGNSILADADRRQHDLVARQIRPLTLLHALQLDISRLRALEYELLQQTDHVTVAERLTRIDTEVASFARHLDRLATVGSGGAKDELFAFEELWRFYRGDLGRVAEAASRMDMDSAGRYVRFLTGPRFDAISAQLKRLADELENRAEAMLADSERTSLLQRRLFLGASILGVLSVGLLIGLLGYSVVTRLARLHEASRSIARGEDYQSAGLEGDDELAALGATIDALQLRVAQREGELRDAHAAVERRVLERTRELQLANTEMSREARGREAAENRLRLLSEALEQSPVGLMILDMQGQVVHANRCLLARSGGRLSELVGRRPVLSFEPAVCARLFREMLTAVLGGSSWSVEVRSREPSGRAIWESMHAVPVRDPEGNMTHVLLVREDITVRKDQQVQILHQAQFDGLTGLPNRTLAGDRLRQSIGHAARKRQLVVLAFLDLDDFKKVNDSLGHEVGDQLLKAAASRLTEVVRSEDTVARLGGDEFVVIMGEVRRIEDAEAVACKILDAFAQPMEVAGFEVVMSTSIGLTVYPNDGEDPGTLMRNADLAMYEAKLAGRNAYRFFDQAVHDSSMRQMELERALRRAIERDELRLVFQPLWALPERRLLGAEALLRWDNPEYGLVYPDRFIEIAERTGLIVQIGEWVLVGALQQLARWRAISALSLSVSVNVSPRQFRDGGLPAMVRRALENSGIPPDCLRLEVTEGFLIDNPPETREQLRQLKAIGVGIAMDDFGTGYSSLSYLQQYPFDSLKIDRRFVQMLGQHSSEKSLVSAAIRMGAGLGLEVVAEGVESEEQLGILVGERCDAAQGFLLGRPVDADEFERRWLQPDPPVRSAARAWPDQRPGL